MPANNRRLRRAGGTGLPQAQMTTVIYALAITDRQQRPGVKNFDPV